MEDVRVSTAFRSSWQAADPAIAEAEKPGPPVVAHVVDVKPARPARAARRGHLEMSASMGEEAP